MNVPQQLLGQLIAVHFSNFNFSLCQIFPDFFSTMTMISKTHQKISGLLLVTETQFVHFYDDLIKK